MDNRRGLESTEKRVPKATFFFPPDFLWGTATSGHQVEGNNLNNDWWAWEQQRGRIQNDGRSGLACNWWENAEADLDRAAQLGNNAHRLSIEWSRVEPEPGRFDLDALSRYRQIIAAVRRRGMEPMVTLHHFTNPQWLAERGAWSRTTVVEAFVGYARRVAETVGDLVGLWIPINEPEVYVAMAYVEAKFPPGGGGFRVAMAAARNMLQAHAKVYHLIHDLCPGSAVGICHNLRIMEPKSKSLLDGWAARNLDHIYNDQFAQAVLTGRLRRPLGRGRIRGLAGTLDFYGLNYYTREMVNFSLAEPPPFFARRSFSPEAVMSDNRYGEIFPRGMFQAIKRAAAYRRPVYITANGLPDADDDQRPGFLITHLRQVWSAIQFNIPVKGYFHWSLVDNFEWDRGWVERFGLVGLDSTTQERTMRRSGELFGRICRAGRIDWEMVHEFAPETLDELFPQ
jgi:beta-glucosidase